MSSMAQEESRSISENVTWGRRKQFADGKFSLGYSRFLGFEKAEGGGLKVVPEEAEVVRLIYKLFLSGKTPLGICKELDRLGIRTPGGKIGWQSTTVASILQNEKYKGDALLQKSYTADFLQKRTKINHGEVQQYYVEGSHEAIVPPSDWERVQAEFRRRKKIGRAYSGNDIFGSRLICEDCGSFFGRKIWHSTDKYRREIYRCNGKANGREDCQSPHLTAETIKKMFFMAYNQLMEYRQSSLEDCRVLYNMVMDTADLEERLAQTEDEMDELAKVVEAYIRKNAAKAQDQEEYQRHYDRLAARYKKAEQKRQTLQHELADHRRQGTEILLFIDSLENNPASLAYWDDTLWIDMIEHGTVHRDGSITFRFKSGQEVKVEKN